LTVSNWAVLSSFCFFCFFFFFSFFFLTALSARADSIEVLREKADIAEAGRMALLWQTDMAAALVKEQEKKDRDDEVEEILKRQGSRLVKQPKSVITPEEMQAVKEVQETDPEKAKKMMEFLRRKEIEAFQKEKKGAKFGYGNEVMCDNCKKFFLSILRCGKCRLAWYCSRECQKEDWRTHKHVCAEEEKKRIAQESAPNTPREDEVPLFLLCFCFFFSLPGGEEGGGQGGQAGIEKEAGKGGQDGQSEPPGTGSRHGAAGGGPGRNAGTKNQQNQSEAIYRERTTCLSESDERPDARCD
jgi:hypothetical protein